MSTNERDTHFANFARLLWQEITAKLLVLDDDESISDGCAVCNLSDEKLAASIEPIIARRAYDFAGHVAESLGPHHPGVDSAYVAWLIKTVESIPDIPSFPERAN